MPILQMKQFREIKQFPMSPHCVLRRTAPAWVKEGHCLGHMYIELHKLAFILVAQNQQHSFN